MDKVTLLVTDTTSALWSLDFETEINVLYRLVHNTGAQDVNF